MQKGASVTNTDGLGTHGLAKIARGGLVGLDDLRCNDAASGLLDAFWLDFDG